MILRTFSLNIHQIFKDADKKDVHGECLLKKKKKSSKSMD
jgi:hypothetical protein